MFPFVSSPLLSPRVPSIRLIGCAVLSLSGVSASPSATEPLTLATHAVTLAWDANPEPDVVGYRLHYGTTGGVYSQVLDVGLLTRYTLRDLEIGLAYYVVVTAYNTAGLESLPSWELVFASEPLRIENAAPVVTLRLQEENALRYAPIDLALEATAMDPDGVVVRVEFFEGERSLGAATTAPWNLAWANVGAGRYAVTAVAHDNAGATSTSAPLAVTVRDRPEPTLSFQGGEPTFGTRAPKGAILEVTGMVGESIRVEYSEDLTEWFHLETVEILGEEGVRLSDPRPETPAGRRFYQLKTAVEAP